MYKSYLLAYQNIYCYLILIYISLKICNLYFTLRKYLKHLYQRIICVWICRKEKKAGRIFFSYFVGRFLIISHLENFAYIIQFPQNLWFLLLNILTSPQNMQSFGRNLCPQTHEIVDFSQTLLKNTEQIKYNYTIRLIRWKSIGINEAPTMWILYLCSNQSKNLWTIN